jgi:hypothetical protein
MTIVIAILVIGGSIAAAILYNRRRIARRKEFLNEEFKGMVEEELAKEDAKQRMIQEAALIKGGLDDYADDYLELPWWGMGEKGMSTKEFADQLGIEKGEARKLLKSWQVLGKVTGRITNKGEVWWRM